VGAAAVIFDCYGTLTVTATRSTRSAGHDLVAAALGVPGDAYAAALLRSWPDRARGRLGDLAETLRAIARECGVEPDEETLARASAARRETQREFVELRPDAVSTLRALRVRGMPTGVVSDCTHELPEQWDELAIAPYVDVTVFSVVEGLKKPEPAIFLLACERLGVEPADCVYVGDGDSNELHGATAVGMRAVRLLTPDHEHGHVFDPVTWTGPKVSSLREVLDILTCEGP
jgi:putative hydrolase of the HAD superfamily